MYPAFFSEAIDHQSANLLGNGRYCMSGLQGSLYILSLNSTFKGVNPEREDTSSPVCMDLLCRFLFFGFWITLFPCIIGRGSGMIQICTGQPGFLIPGM